MSRVPSIDVIRIIAILAVVSIHTTPFELQSTPVGHTLDIATVVNQISRFAVPTFFVLSGYFWGSKFNSGEGVFAPTLKMARKITVLFLAWSAVYLLPFNIVDSFSYGPIGPIKQIYWNLANFATQPSTLFTQGTKVHLWFLVGLLSSLLISALLIRLNLNRLLASTALLLYFIGLAGKAYSDTPLGYQSNFNFRDGPFFSLVFFVTGYFLQRKQAAACWFPAGCALTVVGVLLHFAELVLLNRIWGTTMLQDYVIGTYFLGVGVALIALSNTKWLNFPRATTVGPLVLGIYASHYIFIDLLRPINLRLSGAATWDIIYVVTVFFLSYKLSLLLSRHQLTKRLVA